MEPDRWRQIKELFNAVLERPAEERSAFLAEACGSADESLKREVESLLAAHQDSATTSATGPVANDDAEDPMLGRRIGAYQVVKQIGEGGMAAVYLAFRADDQYRKQVAIKLVPLAMASRELVQRFRNERQTLAALEYPNIVRLLDGGATEDGRPYLVMEYVQGTPITQYADTHRLSTTERLELFRQVCSAVSYAHQRLVIHRDLKPANILVTAEGSVKLLDFGIAKLLNPEVSAQPLVWTGTGQRLMTPEYASPEQVRGEPLTNATDTYSLGVVLYELLTGHRPYHLKNYTVAEFVHAICEEEPKAPSDVVTQVETETQPDGTAESIQPEAISRIREGGPKKLRHRLAGDLDIIVLTALRKEPQRRYASVYEFSADIGRHLEELPVHARPATISYRTGKLLRRHKETVTAVLVAAVLFGGILVWQARRQGPAPALGSSPPPVDTAHVKLRRSVAVLGFKNLSGRPDAAWLSTALSEMLTTELAAGGKLRTLPGENVAQMKINLLLPDADSFGGETLAKIRKNLGSDDVVLGAYLVLGNGQVRLDLKLQDAASGEVVDSVTQSGREQDVADLVSRCGASLRAKLGAGEVTEAEAATVKASLPSNPEAAKLYSEGLKKLRTWEDLTARDLLQKAVAIQPNFALGHSALAAAWAGLGYDAKAEAEAKKAFELSTNLSHEDGLWVEGRYRETVNEWDKAADIYRALFSSFPDNLEYGLALAGAQSRGDKFKDSLVTVEALRGLPSPARDDPRIDFREAGAAQSSGDFRGAVEAAERGIQRAESVGARLLVADLAVLECGALESLADFRRALASCEEARRVYTAAGDVGGTAHALTVIGLILQDQGRLTGALRAFEEASAICSKLGHKMGEANTLTNIGGVYGSRGELHAAEERIQRAISIFEEIGDKSDAAGNLGNLATDIVWHDPLEAAEPAQKSLAVAEQVGDKVSQVVALYALGQIHYFLGDLPEAKRKYEDALRVAGEAKTPVFKAWVLKLQGDLLTAQGNIEEARQKYQEALTIQNETGQKNYGAQTQLSLDALLIDAGEFGAAEKGSREALQEFRKNGDADDAVWARAILAQTLLREREVADAERQIEEGAFTAAKDDNRANRFQFNIAASQIYAAVGKTSKAEKMLEATIAEATKYKFVPYEFEARLALGDLEMKSGKPAAGRARLGALQRDATAKGFVTIARKAAKK